MSVSDELDDAVICVARAAQELSDEADPVDERCQIAKCRLTNGDYVVPKEAMLELRGALARWRIATNAFLELAHNQGADTGKKR